jgi:uncharacterized ion transporter superfamily protein YfcC
MILSVTFLTMFISSLFVILYVYYYTSLNRNELKKAIVANKSTQLQRLMSKGVEQSNAEDE